MRCHTHFFSINGFHDLVSVFRMRRMMKMIVKGRRIMILKRVAVTWVVKMMRMKTLLVITGLLRTGQVGDGLLNSTS